MKSETEVESAVTVVAANGDRINLSPVAEPLVEKTLDWDRITLPDADATANETAIAAENVPSEAMFGYSFEIQYRASKSWTHGCLMARINQENGAIGVVYGSSMPEILAKINARCVALDSIKSTRLAERLQRQTLDAERKAERDA